MIDLNVVLPVDTDAEMCRCRREEEGLGDKGKDREKMHPVSAVTPKSQQDVWCAVHPPLHPAPGS